MTITSREVFQANGLAREVPHQHVLILHALLALSQMKRGS